MDAEHFETAVLENADGGAQRDQFPVREDVAGDDGVAVSAGLTA